MFALNASDKAYRHGDHGPKYLMMGPNTNFGIVRLRPDDQVKAHYHEKMEENFYLIKGSVVMTIDGHEHTFVQGDFIHVEPGEVHALKNTGTDEVQFVVTTSPYMDGGDKVVVDE